MDFREVVRREEAEQAQLRQPMLRSIHNRHSSFVRFVNTTNHRVGVYWVDYQGKNIRYKVLVHRADYLDINTFVTHPWIFIDEETKDRFTGNGQEVYFPQPWFANYRGRSRSELPAGMRIQRTNVLISLPMYSLRDLCLRTIKRMLRNDRQALNLEIPASLRQELYHMHPRKPDPQDREQGEPVQEEQR